MEHRTEHKNECKPNIWHVIFVFGGVWAFILLGNWSGLLLVEAWKAIKTHALEAYITVSNTTNVLKAGGIALCVAMIYAICEWVKTDMNHKPKKQKRESKPKRVKKRNACKAKKSLDGELFIEEREEEKNSENALNPVESEPVEVESSQEEKTEEPSVAVRTRRRPQKHEESEETSTNSDEYVGEELG